MKNQYRELKLETQELGRDYNSLLKTFCQKQSLRHTPSSQAKLKELLRKTISLRQQIEFFEYNLNQALESEVQK